ncbi:right-handed parallel beta-helix repeat-containing protein [Peribacillus glennii]|uniref:Right-handed parallel beta-helix repeat-containing protein n=1 Tax=Peribacillus glennii TaxID=2303991 RepID=A0A372LKR7_9BACI|nr:right-handed parallel beta-helix repeat-containing protein [Peribacillus glennii]RFU66691.1 right-handed parallel beta-helix repeat-containing protein [Peribacillus glennii]
MFFKKNKWIPIVSFFLFFTLFGSNVKADTAKTLLDKKYNEIHVEINNEKDHTKKIQEALNQALNSNSPIKVMVPEGTFHLDKPLYIYKDTYLRLSPKTTFIREHKTSLIRNGNKSNKSGGYEGNSNIVIDGGTWVLNEEDSFHDGNGLSLGHGQNMLIQNTIIKNVANSHAIDLAGVKDIIIKDNKFLGYKDSTVQGYRFFSEAVQVDVLKSETSFPSFGPYDKTQTVNLKVYNNYFGSSDTEGFGAWPRGVGSHTYVIQRPYANIEIVGNIFDNMALTGIRAYGWNNVEIKSNKFIKNKKAIVIDTPAIGNNTEDVNDIQTNKSEAAEKFTIENNEFDATILGSINVKGQSTGLISDVKILNNKFLNSSLENFIIKNSHTENIETDVKYYQIISLDYEDYARAAKVAKEIQLKENLEANVQEQDKKDTVYKIKTAVFKNKKEAGIAEKKLEKIGNVKATIKKNYNKRYYLETAEIKGKEKTTTLYNKIKKETKWTLYRVDTKKQITYYKIIVKPFTSVSEAKKRYENLRKYGLTLEKAEME